MLCRDALPLLSPQIDAELSTHASDALEAHLRECGSCRSRRDHLIAARAAIVACPTPPLSSGFAGQLAARLSQEARPIVTRPVWRWWWAAAAAAVLAFLGIVQLRPASPPAEQVATTQDQLAIDCGMTAAAMCRPAWPCLSAATCGAVTPSGLTMVRLP